MTEKKYGFIDKTGRVVIEPKYDEAGVFSEGFAYVKKGESHYYINKSGRTVIELDEECINGGNAFHEGIATVSGYNKMGIIDKTGRRIGHWIGGYVEGFHEGLSRVETDYGCGFIDKTGQFVIEPEFKSAGRFQEGLAWATYDSRYEGNPKGGYIDKTGRFVIPPVYKLEGRTFCFSEGLAIVNVGSGCKHYFEDNHGYIDRTGKIIIEAKYNNAFDFHEGLAHVCQGRNRYIIDKRGNIVSKIDDHFGAFFDFCEGYALAEFGDILGYIDKTGEIAIEAKFENASSFSEGLACVKYGGRYGFINKTGHFVIEPQFEHEPSDFHEGLARVKIEREVRQATVVNNYESTQKTQQRPASPSTSTKQNTKSGCWTTFLVLLIIAAIAGGVYWYIQNQESSNHSDWYPTETEPKPVATPIDETPAETVEGEEVYEEHYAYSEQGYIQEIVEEYTQAVANNDFATLENLYAPQVSRYINENYLSRDDVLAHHRRYDEYFQVYGKHSSVRWNTLDIRQFAEDKWYVEYIEDFTLDRYDPSLYSVFVRKMGLILNENYKIVSVEEEILEKGYQEE